MTPGTPTPTFRDPAGSLSLEGEFAVRTIHAAARDQVLEFISSPFCSRLQERGDMVATTISNAPDALKLLHPRIPVPTYPWEWTPSQWLAAAELTLSLCEEALNEGWVLKDATPLNILFVGSRPVLVWMCFRLSAGTPHPRIIPRISGWRMGNMCGPSFCRC
jgi:hypothetical protein